MACSSEPERPGINSSYSLASKGCQGFKLMLTPLNLDGFNAKLTIHSTSEVLGQEKTDISPELRAEVGGPVLAPDGMDLGILELNNKIQSYCCQQAGHLQQ